MHLQVQHRVHPQVHLLLIILLNSVAVTSASPLAYSKATQLQPQMHPKFQPQM